MSATAPQQDRLEIIIYYVLMGIAGYAAYLNASV